MSIYKNDILDYVRLSVESVLNQTYSDFDFFIQFDGIVNDDVNNYLTNNDDERIKLYVRNENKGLAVSLNDLLAIVRKGDYEYVARMDADDICLTDRFEKQLAYLERHPEIDLIGGAINEIDEHGNDRGKITRYPSNPEDCKSFFAKRNPVAHPTVVFRRCFFDKVGWAYPTDYIRNEDTRLWLECYIHGCVIANISDVVLNFRMTDSMFKSRRNGKYFAKSQLELRKKIKKELGYGPMSLFYAYAMYLLMISPSWVLKSAYKIFR